MLARWTLTPRTNLVHNQQDLIKSVDKDKVRPSTLALELREVHHPSIERDTNSRRLTRPNDDEIKLAVLDQFSRVSGICLRRGCAHA